MQKLGPNDRERETCPRSSCLSILEVSLPSSQRWRLWYVPHSQGWWDQKKGRDPARISLSPRGSGKMTAYIDFLLLCSRSPFVWPEMVPKLLAAADRRLPAEKRAHG